MRWCSTLLLLAAAAARAGEGWVTHAVALSPDGATIVRGRMHAEKGTSRIRIEDAKTGKIRHEARWSGPIRAFAFRGDGKRFVASNDKGPLKVIDPATGATEIELPGHRGWVHAVAFKKGRVASAGRDDTVRVWDAATGKQLWKRDASAGAVALSPDATVLATTDRAGKVRLFDAATGEPRRTLAPGGGKWVFQIAFSPDGKRVAAGTTAVKVWGVGDGDAVATLPHDERVTALAFAPDGTKLATADGKHVIRLWNLATKKVERTWTRDGHVGALVFDADGAAVTSAGAYSGAVRHG